MHLELDEIDLGFVVSVAVLREVLTGPTVNGRRWWIASDPADAISNGWLTIGHSDERGGYRRPLLTVRNRPVSRKAAATRATDRVTAPRCRRTSPYQASIPE